MGGLPVPDVIWWRGGSYMYEKPTVLFVRPSVLGGTPHVLLRHEDASCPSALWVFPLSALTMGMPHIHPYRGTASCLSALWGGPTSIHTTEVLHQIRLLLPNTRG